MPIKINCTPRDIYMNKNAEYPNILATANITIDDVIAIKGLTIMEGKNGRFVNMPQKSYKKDGETVYKDIAMPIVKGLRQHISDVVCKAYEEALAYEAYASAEVPNAENQPDAGEQPYPQELIEDESPELY